MLFSLFVIFSLDFCIILKVEFFIIGPKSFTPLCNHVRESQSKHIIPQICNLGIKMLLCTIGFQESVSEKLLKVKFKELQPQPRNLVVGLQFDEVALKVRKFKKQIYLILISSKEQMEIFCPC